MSSLSLLHRRPVCLNCIWRSIGEDTKQIPAASWTQARGKKKLAKKADTINVRLLVDMKTYGRKGTITPVAPGRMRNSWYPRQQAEYVSTLSDIDPKTVVAERDTTFNVQDPKKKEAPKPSYDPVTLGPMPIARTNLLTPQTATVLLSELLPARLLFHRTPIAETEPEKGSTVSVHPQSRRAASQAAQETYAASEPTPSSQIQASVPSLRMIYGSVASADVAEAIKDLLAITKNGQRVVVAAEDIKFVGEGSEGIEGDRVKALGDFEVEIRIKGGDAAVKRIVGVVARER